MNFVLRPPRPRERGVPAVQFSTLVPLSDPLGLQPALVLLCSRMGSADDVIQAAALQIALLRRVTQRFSCGEAR
jgi:hypothetical protein